MLLHAPAKVNLFLELRSKMASGFHELETVMAAVSWFDTLSFRKYDSEQIDLEVRMARGSEADGSPPDGIPQGRGNLVYQAVEALKQ